MSEWWIERAGQPLPVLYRAHRTLAGGAHCQVHLARSDEGTWAAIKVPIGDAERCGVEATIEERIVEQLDHRNVVRYLGRGVDERGGPALAYERVHDNPLLLLSRAPIRARLPKDPGTRYYPLPARPTMALAVDLFRALEHMHRRSFVHHDVKLANIMLRVALPEEDACDRTLLDRALAGQGEGVLIDLGAARSAAFLAELNQGKATDARLAPSQLTPLYAPPEALDPQRPVYDPSIDIYAAALVLYSCASGRTPYDHLRMDATLDCLRALKVQERAGQLLPISFEALEVAPGLRPVAGELHGFLSACLHRDPAARPSPTEARRYVEQMLDLCSVGWRAAPRGPSSDMFLGATVLGRGRA